MPDTTIRSTRTIPPSARRRSKLLPLLTTITRHGSQWHRPTALGTGRKWRSSRGYQWPRRTRTSSARPAIRSLFRDGAHDPAYDPMAGNPYYLYTSFAALNAPKEWYYNAAAGQLYLYAPGGAHPQGPERRSPHRDPMVSTSPAEPRTST